MARVNLFTQADDLALLRGVEKSATSDGEAVPNRQHGQLHFGQRASILGVYNKHHGPLLALQGGVLLRENFFHILVALGEAGEGLLLIHEIGRANKE